MKNKTETKQKQKQMKAGVAAGEDDEERKRVNAFKGMGRAVPYRAIRLSKLFRRITDTSETEEELIEWMQDALSEEQRRDAVMRLKDVRGRTLLMLACASAKHVLLDYFLRMEVSDVNRVDEKGNSCLHIAASIGASKCIRVLCRNGICVLETRNASGNTAFGVAFMQKHTEAMAALLIHGAEICLPHGFFVTSEKAWSVERRVSELGIIFSSEPDLLQTTVAGLCNELLQHEG